MQLQGKRILLGVTGSIAAYKAAHLTRLLVKEGAEVQIIMSTSALDFITPLTLATLSKKPVLEAFYDRKSGEWSNHVDLGLWADLFLVAPISANTLSKFANGGCDNLLTATYLSARCPVMVAPAMDLDMYQHPSVKANLDKIASFGNIILEAESGELASGLMGQGRLMEPEHIVERVIEHFSAQQDFKGKTVLITAGPTHEAIDPVRFIGNHSSGKMGIALANALAQRGADVKLVLGPSSLSASHDNITTIPVKSAEQMFEACKKHHPMSDYCIFAAAVADYTPEEVATQKIKKDDDDMVIRLKKNVDIASTLGKQKKEHQVHIGFALETNQEEENALGKLTRKNFDMVVLNSMNDNGAGFQHDTNKVTFYFKDGHKEPLMLLPKTEVATQIIQAIKKISSKN
ncbi:bifunctional phosphopantothenoylcysteine decarboxylase/phosphopantothenate--cysteine ligase CoaBC [Litoribacter ruber]|uniref:bifunctional phosphopantothenoylcysteine decarboxylase/phosphopantothenate--cysteine ligase CoaBC n=1 Tax=Litoribacter ruber TaxID=702568 RepID=UPI001BD99875|nr:bifunctional phosphopantothenoylcysteine decarboxylase/phosphopantothenate--cysteine ligase CoaBC [Litoribacter ruber]MBT0811137.1 bifunctional phosphopantothenoylcysteine decarboxylase/phosphopantothenate--cysteine ligase CoaBC [Litoribacter ruber]